MPKTYTLPDKSSADAFTQKLKETLQAVADTYKAQTPTLLKAAESFLSHHLVGKLPPGEFRVIRFKTDLEHATNIHAVLLACHTVLKENSTEFAGRLVSVLLTALQINPKIFPEYLERNFSLYSDRVMPPTPTPPLPSEGQSQPSQPLQSQKPAQPEVKSYPALYSDIESSHRDIAEEIKKDALADLIARRILLDAADLVERPLSPSMAASA